MAWNFTHRQKGLRNRKQKAVVRNGKIRAAKADNPNLSLHKLAGKFKVSHMTIKRALDKQTLLDI